MTKENMLRCVHAGSMLIMVCAAFFTFVFLCAYWLSPAESTALTAQYTTQSLTILVVSAALFTFFNLLDDEQRLGAHYEQVEAKKE